MIYSNGSPSLDADAFPVSLQHRQTSLYAGFSMLAMVFFSLLLRSRISGSKVLNVFMFFDTFC